jgi:MoxR-like ATPase
LPEAQLDRFLFKVFIRHPSPVIEKRILVNHLQGFDATALDRFGLQRIVTAEEMLAMQAALEQVRVDEGVLDYITDIVARTRTHRSIYLGASPRASIALLWSARAQAASEGRDFVVPDDVKSLAAGVLRHRIGLHPDAEIEGVSPDDCVEGILREAKVPKMAAVAG